MQEYEELTSKLHDFSEKEQSLQERLSNSVVRRHDAIPPAAQHPPMSSSAVTVSVASSASNGQHPHPPPPVIPTAASIPSSVPAGKRPPPLPPINIASSSSLTTAPTNTTTTTNSSSGGGGMAAAVGGRSMSSTAIASSSTTVPSSSSSMFPPESPLLRYGAGGQQQQNHDVDSDSSNPALTPVKTTASGSLAPSSGGGAGGGASSAPKSPAKGIIRVHLDDHGHTFVPNKQGITIREALSKAMKLRKLAPETCAVYKVGDPNKTPISWDTDISHLDGKEIKVEMSDCFPVTTSISHNFVRKTFFSLAFCECCRRLLFTVGNIVENLFGHGDQILYSYFPGFFLSHMRLQVPPEMCRQRT